jgi:hypothetical protein
MASLQTLLREMRGSALWDGVKWLWCAGGTAVSLAVQATLGFFRGHQDLTALLLTVGAFGFLFLAGTVLPRKNQVSGKAVDGETHASPNKSAPKAVPSHDVSEQREFLSLSNEFNHLTWVQQAALWHLWLMASCPFGAFVSVLRQKGFGTEVGKLVSDLKDTVFVEITGNDLTMRPHPARRNAIKTLLEDWKEHI